MGSLGNDWGAIQEIQIGIAVMPMAIAPFPYRGVECLLSRFRFAIPLLRRVSFPIAVFSRVSSADSESVRFNDWVTDMIGRGGKCGSRLRIGGRAL
jgi:hypothetical protein